MTLEFEFVVATPKHGADIMSFLEDNFFDDAPMLHSSEAANKEKHPWIYQCIKAPLKLAFVAPNIEQCFSLLAYGPNGQIAGVALCKAVEKDEAYQKPSRWNTSILKWILPTPLYKICLIRDFNFFDMKYDPQAIMEEMGCNKVFCIEVLATAQRFRGHGLASKLTKQAMSMAKKSNADVCVVLATNMYSQRIFKRQGFEVFVSKNYSDFKDGFGNIVVDKSNEHKHCQTLFKVL